METPADRRRRCDKRWRNNQPEDERDGACGGGAKRGREASGLECGLVVAFGGKTLRGNENRVQLSLAAVVGGINGKNIAIS